MAGPYDFTGQDIENTYQRVLQTPDGVTFYDGTGSLVTITATATAGGSNTQIQFNSASLLSGSSNFSFDYINNSVILTGSLDFYAAANAITSQAGRLHWNDVDGTLELGLKGGAVSTEIGQGLVTRIVNKTVPNIDLIAADYQVVVVSGAQGQRLAVKLAKADNDANSAGTLGLVAENINKNQEGFVVTVGLLKDIDTTGNLQGETWNDGDVLYLSPITAGAITNIKPQAPQHTVIVGYVEYAHPNNGKIYVKIDNGYELDELHNVRITTSSLATGDLLMYDSGSLLWKNSKILSGSYTLSGSLTTDDGVSVQSLTASFVSASSITGSLFGTSSWASNAITASYVQTAQTASYVLNAVSSSYALTASHAQTASYVLNAVSASYATLAQTANTASYILQAVSASYSSTASYVENAQTASYVVLAQTASYVLNAVSSSFASTASYVQNAQTASYVLNAVSSSYSSVANSVNTLNQNVTISGSLTITQDLTVLGSSSIVYITSSELNIGTNLITVNTNNPGIRFGGLAVIDSGSSPQVSGSFLFDSQKNQYIFVHQGSPNTSSVFLLGPETYNNIGNETYLTQNRLPKGSGIEHLNDSNITDTGTVVSINSDSEITGSLKITAGITGSLFGISSTASYVENAQTASYVVLAQTASFVTTAQTASFVTTAQTASYVLQAVSSSFASTASFVITAQTASFVTSSNVYGPYGANSILSASFAISASWAPGGSGTTINNNIDNYIITATGVANTLNGEANLQFNGSTLTITGNVTANSFTGSLQGTATTASYVNGSRIKSNAVSSGTFTGNPKKATVTFASAYPDTNYSITITGEDARTWTIESKLAGSFVINANSNTALSGTTYWQTINYGEFNS